MILGPIAPKDPVKKRDFFYIMSEKQISAAPAPDGRGLCHIYEDGGRMLSAAKIVGGITDEAEIDLLKTTEGFKKLVFGIGVSVMCSEVKQCDFAFQMYGKSDPYVSGTTIKQTVSTDGVEYLIPLSEISWSDDDNVPVQDFELARHIYDYLSRKGYRVFMTGKNLKNSRRQDAIPMLQTAIESAKILVLVGTSREYIDDASVESEWMRYFIVNRGVKNKGFAPCYYEMDPKDLPQEMLKSSPIDMSVEGYEEEILKRVAYYTSGSASGSASEATPAPKPAQPVQETPAAEEENVSAASANEPEAAPEQEEAGFGGMGFDEEELGFDILEATKIYDDAFAKEKKARFDYELKQIGDAYASIKGFRDSQARAQECYKRAEEIRQEALYQEALRSFHKCKDHVDYLRTRLLFETISGYKDADGRARECAILAKRVKKQQQQEIIDKEIEAIENKKAEAEKVVEQAKKKEEEEDKPSMVLRILVIVIALAAIGGLGFFFKDQIMNAVSYYQGLLG